MKRWLLPVLLCLAPALAAPAEALPAQAEPACQFEKLVAGSQKIGPWINKGNWLDIENRTVSLRTPETFMPALKLAPVATEPWRAHRRPFDLDALKASDPLDGREQTLSFLLDSRLHADGLLILQQGSVVAERYRHGLRPENLRPLLEATRPLLALLGAIAAEQGELSVKKSVLSVVPALGKQPALRKLSVQRLLEGDEQFEWSGAELDYWLRASGWGLGQAASDSRAWLAQTRRWERPLRASPAERLTMTPDLDLLAWVLTESTGMPLARLFCERLLPRNAPEYPLLWLTDAQGRELAGGLSLSLRDFARLGQVLLAARSTKNRSQIPNWLLETLAAPVATREPPAPLLAGLSRGSENRYGFVHLGASNGVAIIGGHGTSLYVDFDNKLVIALYASHPKNLTPALLATLEQVWKTASAASAGRALPRK